MKMYVITIMENERPVQVADRCIASGLKFGIVISRFNDFGHHLSIDESLVVLPP